MIFAAGQPQQGADRVLIRRLGFGAGGAGLGNGGHRVAGDQFHPEGVVQGAGEDHMNPAHAMG